MPHAPKAPKRGALLARTAVSLLLSAGLLAVGLWAFQHFTSTRHQPPKQAAPIHRIAVETRKIPRGTHCETHTAYGMVEAVQHAQVTAEISGVIVWVSPELRTGQPVQAGDELVRIDDGDLKDQLAKALSAREQGQAELDQILAERENDKRLLALKRQEATLGRQVLARLQLQAASNVQTEEAVERQQVLTLQQEAEVVALENRAHLSQPAEVQARAAIARQDADINLARRQVSRTVIKAPADGRIGTRHAHLGGKVAPGTVLFDLIDPQQLQLQLRLPSTAAGLTRPGSGARLFLGPDRDQVYTTTVARVSAQVQPPNSQLCVWVDLDTEELPHSLLPGTLVRASVDGKLHPDVIAVPRAAMVDDTVFIARRSTDNPEEGIVAAVRPTIAAILQDVALVTSGLDPGDDVILTSVEAIDNGSRILFAQPEAAPQGASRR